MQMAKWILVVIASLVSFPASAELYASIYGYSYHTDRSRGFNEDNVGWGLRYNYNQAFVEAGRFVDSMNKNAMFAAVGYQWPLGEYFEFAVMGGALKQEKATLGTLVRQEQTVGAIMPMVRIKTGALITNVSYVPKSTGNNLFETVVVYWSLPIKQ